MMSTNRLYQTIQDLKSFCHRFTWIKIRGTWRNRTKTLSSEWKREGHLTRSLWICTAMSIRAISRANWQLLIASCTRTPVRLACCKILFWKMESNRLWACRAKTMHWTSMIPTLSSLESTRGTALSIWKTCRLQTEIIKVAAAVAIMTIWRLCKIRRNSRLSTNRLSMAMGYSLTIMLVLTCWLLFCKLKPILSEVRAPIKTRL